MPAKGSYVYNKGGYRFTWTPGDGMIDISLDGKVFDAIQVWSYSSGGGENTIGADRPSFVAECDEWVEENAQYKAEHRMIPG